MSMEDVVFMENQTGTGRDFISLFVTQSNLGRLSSDCNLVSQCLQHQRSGGFGTEPRMTMNSILNSRMYTVENVVDKLSNRGLMLMNKSVLTQMNSAQMSQEKVQSVRMFEHNFTKHNKYFPF